MAEYEREGGRKIESENLLLGNSLIKLSGRKVYDDRNFRKYSIGENTPSCTAYSSLSATFIFSDRDRHT